MGQGWVFGGQSPRARGSPKSRDGDLRMGGEGCKGNNLMGRNRAPHGFCPEGGSPQGLESVCPTKQLPTIVRTLRTVRRVHHVVTESRCRAPLLNHLLIGRFVRAGRIDRIPSAVGHDHKHSHIRTVILILDHAPRLLFLGICHCFLHLIVALRARRRSRTA